MCLHPEEIPPVPKSTALVAKSAFPKGNLYMRLRDELGAFYHDEDFASSGGDKHPRTLDSEWFWSFTRREKVAPTTCLSGNKLAISKNIPLQNSGFMVKKNGLANITRPPQKLIIYVATILPNNSGKISHKSPTNYFEPPSMGATEPETGKNRTPGSSFSITNSRK